MSLLVAILFSSIVHAEEPLVKPVTIFPEGWFTGSPRAGILPQFAYDATGGRDGKGAFTVASDEREGLRGWWTKTISSAK